MIKVYFACSIRGGRDDARIYAKLVEAISANATVLTEIFADQKLTSEGMNKPSEEIWKIDLDWVRQANVLIAEVSTPSLGVGYEIAKAEEWGKPILCLYRPQEGRKLSAMIAGSPSVTIFEYHEVKTAEQAIATFISNLEPR